MTEKQINEQLVEDIARILTIAGSWSGDAAPTDSCEKRERSVANLLNGGEEQKLIVELQKVLSECDAAGKGAYKNILSRSYIKNTITLLGYRIESAASKNGQIAMPAEHYDPVPYYEDATRELRRSRRTVLGYRALELSGGSVKNLEEAIEVRLRKQVHAKVQTVSDPTVVYREKCPYLEHKIWATTQLLPMIIVSEDEG